jgi:Skp family chaperone for outer membrane proteins
MKNGLIIPIVIGIGVLAFLASCGDSESEVVGSEEGGLKIAYYVQDSLASHLEYFKTSQEEMTILNDSYSAKGGALQDEYQRVGQIYQQKSGQGLLSANQEASYQKELGKLQQQLQDLEQTEGANLQSKAAKFEMDLIEKLKISAEEFSKEHEITLFLAKDKIGTVLYADSTMDMTADFIDFMNK